MSNDGLGSEGLPSSLKYEDLPYERLTIGKATSTMDWLLWEMGMTTNAEELADKIRVWNEINKDWLSNISIAQVRFYQNTKDEDHQQENKHCDEISPQVDELNQKFLEFIFFPSK